MKTFTEVKYQFGDDLKITTAGHEDVVRLTFEETHGDDCKRIHVSMSALCARRAATVLAERATVSEEEESTDESLESQFSLATELAQSRIDLEKAQEKVSLGHAKLSDAIARIKRMQQRW